MYQSVKYDAMEYVYTSMAGSPFNYFGHKDRIGQKNDVCS